MAWFRLTICCISCCISCCSSECLGLGHSGWEDTLRCILDVAHDSRSDIQIEGQFWLTLSECICIDSAGTVFDLALAVLYVGCHAGWSFKIGVKRAHWVGVELVSIWAGLSINIDSLIVVSCPAKADRTIFVLWKFWRAPRSNIIIFKVVCLLTHIVFASRNLLRTNHLSIALSVLLTCGRVSWAAASIVVEVFDLDIFVNGRSLRSFEVIVSDELIASIIFALPLVKSHLLLPFLAAKLGAEQPRLWTYQGVPRHSGCAIKVLFPFDIFKTVI